MASATTATATRIKIAHTTDATLNCASGRRDLLLPNLKRLRRAGCESRGRAERERHRRQGHPGRQGAVRRAEGRRPRLLEARDRPLPGRRRNPGDTSRVTDIWADWLRTRRTGGDAEYEARLLAQLAQVRDRVLDNARLEPTDRLLDVGCGNGLIAFGALERGTQEVVFADISKPLLDDCAALAEANGLTSRCRFVEAPATDLDPIADQSIDVVTTRSVLIYVEEKDRAFREFHRVLRPGGRISLFEPINRFGKEERRSTWGYELDGASKLLQKLNDLFERFQPSDDPMLDFDERDLLVHAERAGFFPITLDYRAEIEPPEARNWETFLHMSGNPKIPTLAEAMDEALTPEERDRLVPVLRPAVEAGRGVLRMGHAYLWAVKP